MPLKLCPSHYYPREDPPQYYLKETQTSQMKNLRNPGEEALLRRVTLTALRANSAHNRQRTVDPEHNQPMVGLP